MAGRSVPAMLKSPVCMCMTFDTGERRDNAIRKVVETAASMLNRAAIMCGVVLFRRRENI